MPTLGFVYSPMTTVFTTRGRRAYRFVVLFSFSKAVGMKQATLYGYVKKLGAEREENLPQKRGADAISYDDSLKTNEKSKLADGFHKVGLGIETWPTTGLDENPVAGPLLLGGGRG